MASKLTTIAQQRSAADLQLMSRQSYDWMMKKIANLKGTTSIASNINRESSRHIPQVMTGGMCFFYYDPKTKADLPYYDRFPLVLVLERYGDGFLGLNLHYLPLQYRLAFLDKLMDYAQFTDENNIGRLRVTYDILSASKKFKLFKPCIKRYLTSQIQSKILAVQPNEWEVAVFLPIQQFRKANASTVWQESLQQARAD